MSALSVGRHAKNATIITIVLSALKEHIFNKCMEISIVWLVHQGVQPVPIAPRVHDASSYTTGGGTVRTTVIIALVTVIKMTVAPQGALMDFIRTPLRMVEINVQSVQPPV